MVVRVFIVGVIKLEKLLHMFDILIFLVIMQQNTRFGSNEALVMCEIIPIVK